ncbi:phosphotransferase [Candidatus Bathyarchaeota archaeon]|nr:phosphotransferase [Candidatus Bathyarchaeota archaeon]
MKKGKSKMLDLSRFSLYRKISARFIPFKTNLSQQLNIAEIIDLQKTKLQARMPLLESETYVGDITKLKGGNNSDVYTFNLCSGRESKSLVLKVYKNQYAILNAMNEYNTLSNLENKGFESAPKVVAFQNITSKIPFAYLLMEKVEGVALDKYLAHATVPNIKKAIGNLVSLIKKLNGVGYQHGDANVRNFIFDGNRMFLLDWQTTLISNDFPFNDICIIFYSIWISFGLRDFLRKKGSSISKQFLKEYLRTKKPSSIALNQYLTHFGSIYLQGIKDYQFNPVGFTKVHEMKYILLEPFMMFYSITQYVALKKFISKLKVSDFYI